MAEGDLYGPGLSLPVIERALTAHVRLWYPTYLADAERSVEFRADGVTPVQPGDVPRPRAWRPAEGRVDKWPADQLPAIIFGSPGLADGVRRNGRGEHSGEWAFGFTAVASARDDTSTRWVVGLHALALRKIFIQQPAVEGLPVESCTYEDEAYDPLPFARSGSLMAATVTFSIGLAELGSARGGPAAPVAGGPAVPPADPLADPPALPEVLETDHDITRRPVDG